MGSENQIRVVGRELFECELLCRQVISKLEGLGCVKSVELMEAVLVSIDSIYLYFREEMHI